MNREVALGVESQPRKITRRREKVGVSVEVAFRGME